MIGMIACLVYIIAQLIILYLSYPVKVSVVVVPQERLAFPAVTVCNLSPVRQSALNGLSDSALGSTLVGKRRRKRNNGNYIKMNTVYKF